MISRTSHKNRVIFFLSLSLSDEFSIAEFPLRFNRNSRLQFLQFILCHVQETVSARYMERTQVAEEIRESSVGELDVAPAGGNDTVPKIGARLLCTR